MRVAFLHPDLGIGGAEQLVVNLALCCKSLGWYVKIFTPSYDPNRAFAPTKDGTLDVEVIGDMFPRRIFGKFHALCEYVRMLIAAIRLILFGGHFDVVVIDQIPFPIPILNIRFRTFFYCHFPDKLLCVERGSLSKKIYRMMIDLIEEVTMLFCSVIVVNSNYTKSIFKSSFSLISKIRKEPSVIYPCIELKDYDKETIKKEDLLKVKGLEELKTKGDLGKIKFVVSLNRYEKKKNLDLAVLAFKEFVKSRNDGANYCLIFAGGFDLSLHENISTLNRLKNYTTDEDNVFFLKNISNDERSILLKTANIVLYTPKNEHFGIVPVEAMYCGAFVIAHKSGGPKESIKDGKTGYLLDNKDPSMWAVKLSEYFNDETHFDLFTGMNNEEIRLKQKEHVVDNFSLTRMKKDFYEALN